MAHDDFRRLATKMLANLQPHQKAVVLVFHPHQSVERLFTDNLKYPNLVNGMGAIADIEAHKINYCDCVPCNISKAHLEELKKLRASQQDERNA